MVGDGSRVGVSPGVTVATTGVVVADGNGVVEAVGAADGTGVGGICRSEQAATKTSNQAKGSNRLKLTSTQERNKCAKSAN